MKTEKTEGFSMDGFSMDDDRIKDIRQSVKAGVPAFSTELRTNPYSTAMYGLTIEALFELGADKRHTLKSLIAKLKECASRDHTIKINKKTGKKTTAWQRFIHKGLSPRAKNDDNAFNQVTKILYNVQVLQRLTGKSPYGYKLLQYGRILKSKGCVIDIYGEPGNELIMLNTDSSKPVKLFAKKAEKPEKVVKARKRKNAAPAVTVTVADAPDVTVTPLETTPITIAESVIVTEPVVETVEPIIDNVVIEAAKIENAETVIK